jgi:hypothetical protein
MGFTLPRLLKRLRIHQFHFIGFIGPEIIAGLAIVDLKALANGFFYLYDRKNRRMMEATALSPFAARTAIGDMPEAPSSTFTSGVLTIEINGPKVSARAKTFSLDAELDLTGVKPLRICTRAGYRGWVYTQKTNPVRVCGSARLDGRSIEIASPATMALTDWTCGFMHRKTFWNWAAIAATLPDGRSLGLNGSCGVNETSFTENAFWIDGVMTKVDTMNFIFDRDNLMNPWQVRSYDGRVNLSFLPEVSRGEKINAGIIASRFTQLVGQFSGIMETEDGEVIRIDNCPGLTEDHYAKW